MTPVVHLKGIVTQVARVVGKVGRSWRPGKQPRVSFKAGSPVILRQKAG